MKWQGRRGSNNIEDRRRRPSRRKAGAGGLGGLGLIAVVVIASKRRNYFERALFNFLFSYNRQLAGIIESRFSFFGSLTLRPEG